MKHTPTPEEIFKLLERVRKQFDRIINVMDDRLLPDSNQAVQSLANKLISTVESTLILKPDSIQQPKPDSIPQSKPSIPKPDSIISQDSKDNFISELKQIFHDGIKSKRMSGKRTIPLSPEELDIAKSIPENDRFIALILSDENKKSLDLFWRINSFNEIEFVWKIVYEDWSEEEKTYIKNTLLRDFPNEEERTYTQNYSLDS